MAPEEGVQRTAADVATGTPEDFDLVVEGSTMAVDFYGQSPTVHRAIHTPSLVSAIAIDDLGNSTFLRVRKYTLYVTGTTWSVVDYILEPQKCRVSQIVYCLTLEFLARSSTGV